MPFQPGQTGNPGGRLKGSKNKYRLDVAELFAKRNYNPILEMIDDAITATSRISNLERTFPELGDKERKLAEARVMQWQEMKNGINKELAQYFAPKLKAIEFRGDPDDPMQINVNISRQRLNGAKLDNVQLDEDGNGISS